MNLMTTDHESLQRLGGISSVRELAARIQGRLLCPGAAGYDPARRVFNAMIDRHPALIIQCAGAADAAAGIGFARTQPAGDIDQRRGPQRRGYRDLPRRGGT